MASIPVKPPRPVIDWSNPITKKMVFAMEFWEKAGSSFDYVNKYNGQFQNGAAWKNHIIGKCAEFDSNNAIVNVATTTKIDNLTGSVSAAVLVFPRSKGESNNGRPFRKGTTSVGRFGIGIDNGQNTYAWETTWSSGNMGWGAPANLYASNTWTSIIVTHENYDVVNTKPTFYINGKKYTTYSFDVTPTTGTLSADPGGISIGNLSTGIRAFDGYIAYVRFWNRVLSDGEAYKLCVNPWVIYRQPKTPLANQIVVAASNLYRMLMGVGK